MRGFKYLFTVHQGFAHSVSNKSRPWVTLFRDKIKICVNSSFHQLIKHPLLLIYVQNMNLNLK